MSTSTCKRLFVLVVVLLAFASYLGMRDTIRVRGELPRKAVKAIVHGVQEWSSPKLLRHIEVEPRTDGTVLASVREPGGRLSVTVFTNRTGAWTKCGWYLLGADKSIVRN